VLTTVCALAALGGTAEASGWAGPLTLSQGAGNGSSLSSVVCPTAGQCTAIDDVGRAVTFNPTSPGTPSLAVLDREANLRAVACSSATQCTAVDDAGGEITFDPQASGTPSSTTIDAGSRLALVACPSTTQCTALDDAGAEVTFNPQAPGSPTPLTLVANAPTATDLTCPLTTECVAVGAGAELTFDPQSPGTPTPNVFETSGGLTAVSCPTATDCTAVDYSGNEFTFDPTSASTPSPVIVESNVYLTNVACSTTIQCTVVTVSGHELTFNPQSIGPPSGGGTFTDRGATIAVYTLACPTTSQCTVVGYGGSEWTFAPNASGSLTATTVDNVNGATVACPSATQCTAVGGGGDEETFDPSAPGTATPVQVEQTGGYLDELSCPTTTQCTAVDSNGLMTTFNPQSPSDHAPTSAGGPGVGGGLSCPSATQCTIVGSGRVATFDPQSPGTPSWAAIDSAAGPWRIACASISQCTVVDGMGREETFAPSAPGTPTSVSIDGPYEPGINAIDCPTSTQCTAVDFNGQEVTFNPNSPGTPDPIATGLSDASSLSCPSETFCTAVGYDRVSAFNPQAPGTSTPGVIASADRLSSVACASASACVTADSIGQGFTGAEVAPPWNTAIPAISGMAAPGQVMSESHGSWTNSPTSFAYQWQECDSSGNSCTAISGATDQTYTLQASDSGHTLRVQETATNAGGSSSPASSAQTSVVIPLAPSNVGAPTLSGTVQQGQTLSESHGSWTNNPTSFAYQWQECDSSGNNCTAITGATNQTYTLQASDVGGTLRVQETATNAGGSSSPASSAQTSVVIPLAPSSVGAPTLSGTVQQGQTLSESHGSWTNSPTSFAYQWQECDSSGNSCTAITGATGQTYTLTAGDLGHTLRVSESATNAGGTGGPVSSAQSGVVAAPPVTATAPSDQTLPQISGTGTVGQVLSSSLGTWSGTTPIGLAAQWQRCAPGCSNITGATGTAYTLAPADAGARVRVVVTATNSVGSAEASSAQVGPIAPSPAQIKASLLRQLAPHGNAAKIVALLKKQGYVLSFTALSTGKLVIDWYYVPAGAHVTRAKPKPKPKPLLVATGKATFSQAGTRKLTITLTANGNQLLKRAQRLKLTAKGAFTPAGKSEVVATKEFTLTR
jgi:hypothetical protein